MSFGTADCTVTECSFTVDRSGMTEIGRYKQKDHG